MLMVRTTMNELKDRRLVAANETERAAFDETYAAAELAIRDGQEMSRCHQAEREIRRGRNASCKLANLAIPYQAVA